METKSKWIIGMVVSFLMGSTNLWAQNPIIAMIGLFGPQGEVISYEKRGNEIFIRECEKNSLKGELESGCSLKEGTSEVRMSVANFKALAALKLKTLAQDSNDLSADQRILLERYLVDVSQFPADIERLFSLKVKFEKNQAFKSENPEDYDVQEETQLTAEIKAIEARLSGIEDIRRAKEEIASLLDALILDMDGKEIKRLLRYSSDREGIAFNLLKKVLSIETCSPEKVANAPQGYMCQVETLSGRAFWSVEVKTASGKKVLKDMKSGLFVSDLLERKYAQYQAELICTNPASLDARGNLSNVTWSLPTGYPKNLNGEYDFPNTDSDFETLDANGVRKVIYMSERWFWSSSLLSGYANNSYYYGCDFYGNSDIDYASRAHSGGSVLCVGR